ncbi:hypothetical protein D3C72_2019540 [compost metagenome]
MRYSMPTTSVSAKPPSRHHASARASHGALPCHASSGSSAASTAKSANASHQYGSSHSCGRRLARSRRRLSAANSASGSHASDHHGHCDCHSRPPAPASKASSHSVAPWRCHQAG